MSLQDYSAELEAENDRLRAALDERDARIDALGDAMLEMARRLDQYERPEPEIGPEIREWVGTAQWSGPAADYWANGAEINAQLAQNISKMMRDAESARNHPEQAESGRKAMNSGIQEAIEASATLREDDTPEGPAYEV